MPTVRDICIRALRKLDVAPLGQEVPGEEIEQAVDAYNDMLHAWALMGVDIGHTTQIASDPFPLSDEFVEGTCYILATRLSPNYMVPAQFSADDWWRSFQARYADPDPVEFDMALTFLPSRRRLGR